MNSKLVAALFVVSTALACASGTSSGTPGSGGATSTSTGHAATTSSSVATTTVTTATTTAMNSASTTGVTIASATTGTGPTMTCDMIGTCQLPGNSNPTKDCITCAVLGTTTMFTDGGVCRPAFNAAFGMDGQCAMGGFPAACAYLTCSKDCEGASGMFDTQMKWDCYCSNDHMGANSTCNTTQTDTSTCLGALEANMNAYQAETAFEDCLYGTTGACVASCLGAG